MRLSKLTEILAYFSLPKRDALSLLGFLFSLFSVLSFLLLTILAKMQNVALLDLEQEEIIWILMLISGGILAFSFAGKSLVRVALQFLVAYPTYLWLASLVFQAYHLNSPDVSQQEIIREQFYQTSSLPLLLGLVTVSCILSLKIFLPYQERFALTVKPDFLVSTVMGAVIATDHRFLSILLNHQWQSVTFFSLLTDLWPVLLVAILGYSYAVQGLWRLVLSFRGKSVNLSSAWFTSLFAGIVLNYHLQFAVKWDDVLLGHHVSPGAISYQIGFFTVLFFLIYLVFNRYLVGTILVSFLVTSISLANQIKVNMRDEPLLITDLVWVKDLELITGFVDQHLMRYLILGSLAIVAAYLLIRPYLFRGQLVRGTWFRSAIMVSLVSFVLSVFNVFREEKDFRIAEDLPVISRLNNEMNVAWLGFMNTAHYKSLAYVWTKQLTTPIMDQVEGYNKQNIEELYRKYSKEAEQINSSRQNYLSDQTVIFVLSESFADPLRVPAVTVSEPVIPRISEIKATTTGGLMRTTFYGGGTANVEFQTLTGLPFHHFSPSVSIAFTEVWQKMAYVPSVSNWFASENRIAIHPSGATNYGRDAVYRDLEFAKFFAKYGSIDSMPYTDKMGVSISDASVYQTILDELQSGQPQFFSVITMQNHAPWLADIPEQVVATGSGFSEAENQNLTSYARLLTHTDYATSAFLEQLTQMDQEITVVFYGDHLPGLYPPSAFDALPENQYLTDYFIWNNKSPNHKLDYPLIGPNDFIATLLTHTDSKVSPYYALLTRYLEDVSRQESELTAEQLMIQHDLQLLQYDLTIGKGYLLAHRDFFEEKE